MLFQRGGAPVLTAPHPAYNLNTSRLPPLVLLTRAARNVYYLFHEFTALQHSSWTPSHPLSCFPLCRRTWTNLRWAHPRSWGPWWRLCVRQQWEVSTRPSILLKPIGTLVALFLSECACSLCFVLCPADDNTNCRVDTAIIQKRLPVLLKYLNSDTERQLQALYALQALIVTLDQPPSKNWLLV